MKKAKELACRIAPYAKDFLPHFTLVLCLMHVTFLIVDLFNRAMAFVNNDITKWLLVVLSFAVLGVCENLRHTDMYKLHRAVRVLLRTCVIGACIVLYIFFLDKESRIINTTLVKYTLYAFVILSSALSVCMIVQQRKNTTF